MQARFSRQRRRYATRVKPVYVRRYRRFRLGRWENVRWHLRSRPASATLKSPQQEVDEMTLDRYVLTASQDKADLGILWWGWERKNAQHQVVAQSQQRFRELQECQTDYLAHQGQPNLPNLQIDEVLSYRYSMNGSEWKEGFGVFGKLDKKIEDSIVMTILGQVEDREKVQVIEGDFGVYSDVEYDPRVDKSLDVQVKDRTSGWKRIERALSYRAVP